jgi:transmembrane sensor
MADHRKPPECKSSEIVALGGPEQEAAEWIARLDADRSPEARAHFEAWKAQGRGNREAAERLEALWSELDVLGELRLAEPAAERRPARGRREGPSRRRTPWLSAAAAAAAVLVVAGGYALLAPQPPQVYETALGKQRTVTLADGSTVQLNTNTVIEVRFRQRARDIRLARGEAFFEVAPDKSRPFTVYAGAGSVQAVGTAFAVRVDHEDLRVTLTKGVIRLKRTEAPASAPDAILTAQSGRHAEAVVTPAGIQREEMDSQAVARELSWRQGILVFDGEPLPNVISDVSRYTDVQIEIADPKLRTLKIAGYFDAGDVDPMLDALESGFGVHVERLGPKRVRLTSGRD